MRDGIRPTWRTREADAVLARFETGPGGLAPDEATRRSGVYGPNLLRRAERASGWRIITHQFTGALTYVLVAALAISLAIGHWEDAAVIGVVLVVNGVVGFFQEYRADNTIAALMGLVSPRATVRRGGRRTSLPSSELVPGVLVLLESGALVPADLRLVRTATLRVDEAPLTGESEPVAKKVAALREDAPLSVAERLNMAFMGTLVTAGRARGGASPSPHPVSR